MKKNQMMPLVVNIKNKTSKRISNVDVFNYDYKENDDIEYSCPHDVSYGQFLREIASYSKPNFYINNIKQHIESSNKNTITEQSESSISYILQNANGIKSVGFYLLSIKQVWNQNKFWGYELEKDLVKIPLFVKTNLSINYLMPNTEITLFLYLECQSEEEREQEKSLFKEGAKLSKKNAFNMWVSVFLLSAIFLIAAIIFVPSEFVSFILFIVWICSAIAVLKIENKLKK
jgi:hypothetical protein